MPGRFVMNTGTFAMGDFFKYRMINTVRFHIIVIHAIDGKSIHEVTNRTGELDSFTDMIRTVFSYFPIQIIDCKQSIPYSPCLSGTDLDMG